MATLTLLQERTNLPEGFKVKNTIQDPVDIPAQLFVINSATEEFSHVATVNDFAYPVVNTGGVGFYRALECEKIFLDVETALEFANSVKLRVNNLVEFYNTDIETFVGIEPIDMPIVP